MVARIALLGVLIACGVVVASVSSAVACHEGRPHNSVTLDQAESVCTSPETSGGGEAGIYWIRTEESCARPNGDAGNVWIKYDNGDEAGRRCGSNHNQFANRRVTPERVLRAMQRLSWPGSALVIQPPEGRTLVNFATNFLTENDEPTRQRVTLLGQRIVIEATPSSYHWDFGDGNKATTSTPGARYPELDVTHAYAKKGRYAPSVGTTYAGRYRVNGGPWLEIPGSHMVAGEPVELEVIGAKPTLVGVD